MRIIARFLLIELAAPPAMAQPTAHTARSAVANSLMQRWVEVFNADDVEALRTFFAENVVMTDDTLGTTGEGQDTLVTLFRDVMTVTYSHEIRPLNSLTTRATTPIKLVAG